MRNDFMERLISGALSTVFTAVSALSAMPQIISAAADDKDNYLYTDDGFAYIVNEDDTITIKGRDSEREYDNTKIVFPSTIDGKTVTRIDTNYFGHTMYGSNSTVTSIVLPDHIEYLSHWCFNDYKALDELFIPATLKEADRPFTYCEINKVIIEDGMEKVPNNLLDWTNRLDELIIPDSVTEIGENAFASCFGLKELHIPDSVRKIGTSAFYGDEDVEVLDLPDELDYIGRHAFSSMKALKSVHIPDTWIFDPEGYDFFYGCGLTEISFGSGVKVIPHGLCDHCVDLEKITWPDAPEEIGQEAFYCCEKITDPKIPDSVKIIGFQAFAYCTGIEHLDLPASLEDLARSSFRNTTSLKELYVPMQLPYPGDYDGSGAFIDSGIEKLTYAEGITEIHGRFAYLPELTEIVLPSTLTDISGYAFAGCPKLSHIDIPEGVTKIDGYRIFGGCDSLKELELPSTLTQSNWSISSAPALEKVTFRDGIERIPYRCLISCYNVTSITIPDSVKEIGESAFEYCPITTFRIPDGVTVIERDAFSRTRLSELTIPAGVTKAELVARNTEDLTTVIFADGIETIPKAALYECPSVEKVVLPASVKQIQSEAFSKCKSLVEIDAPQEEIPFELSAFDWTDNLWDQRFAFVENNGLYMTQSSISNAEGSLVNYTIHYSINPRFRDKFSLGWIYVDSNYSDSSFVEESYDGYAQWDYGRLRYDVTEPEGTIHFSVRSDGKNELKVSSWMYARIREETSGMDGRNVITDSVEIADLSLRAPENASMKDGISSFYVSGSGPLDSEVTIRVNDEDNTTVKTNKYSGRYSALVTYEGNDTDITVEAVCGEVKSAKKTVAIIENAPELVKVIYRNGVNKTDMTDTFLKGKGSYALVNPFHVMGFEVEVSDSSNIEELCMISEKNGDISAMPLKYNDDTGMWEGTGHFDTTVPGKLSVTQLPKQMSGMLCKTVNNGETSFKFKGSDNDLSPTAISSGSGSGNDIAKAFLDHVDTSVAAGDENNTLVRYDYTPSPSFKKLNPDMDEVSIGVYQGITDVIGIGGKNVEADTIADDPDSFGFTESAVRMTDENGDIHTFFAKVLTETEDAVAAAESLMIPDGVSAVYDTAMDFLSAKPYDYMTGVIIIDRNETTGESKAETQLVANREAVVDPTFLEALGEDLKDHTGEQLIGADLAILTDIANEGLTDLGQTALGSVAAGFTVFNSGCEMVTAGIACSEQRAQINFSKDPYVQAHKKELKAEAENIFVGRLVTITASASATILATFAGLTLWPGLLVGGAICLTTYVAKKYYDAREKKLKKIIYRDPRNKIGNSAEPTYILDPSGTVYEVVEDNKVEGATAEIWYKDEDGNEVLWNAEDYDQVNPQLTNSDGWFAWDVPEGLWQVRVSKENYEDAASDWLTVLPVQTGILIPMISKASAKLADVTPYSDRIEMKFSAFLKDGSVTADSLYLTDKSGNKVPCRIKLMKSESNKTEFSDTVWLISEGADFTGSSLVLTDEVLTYNGNPVEPVTMKLDITSAGPPVEIEDDIIIGDVNDDGMVDSNDATAILAEYSSSSTGGERTFTDKQMKAGDVNKDGFVDSGDASGVLMYYAFAQTDGSLTPNEYFNAA